MSMPTLTLIATPDPEDQPDAQTLAQLRDRLALADQAYGDLLAAARATVAADAQDMSTPLGWLTDHLTFIDAMPEIGARPTDYQPTGPDGGVWGRR